MAGDLRDLPRRQTGEDGVGECLALGLQPSDLVVNIEILLGAEMPQLLEHRLQFGDGSFEVQTVVRVHGRPFEDQLCSGMRMARYSDSLSRRTSTGTALPLGSSLTKSTNWLALFTGV